MELALSPPAARLRSVPPLVESAPDRELLRRIATGDRAAFELLYRRYVRPVYALALRRLGDRERAEEAVQDVFTSVWRSAGSYHPERGPAAPWVYAIARNAIVDRFRVRSDPASELADGPSGEAGPQEQAEASWVAWRVHRAVAELPEQERVVLELAYWRGLSQSEVASELAIPLGTVKTRTRSALGRLAARLEEDME